MTALQAICLVEAISPKEEKEREPEVLTVEELSMIGSQTRALSQKT